MWKRRRGEPERRHFDWPLRWRETTPAPGAGHEPEIAALFAAAADSVAPATEIDRQRAWARLRAGVQPARPWRAWAPALVAGLVAVLAVAGWFTAARPVDSGLRQLVLRSAVVAGLDAETAAIGGQVAAGTPIRTASNAIATVDVGTVGVLLLQRDTEVATRPLAGRVVRVKVERGEVVGHLQPGSPLGLAVEAGGVEVEVTGTVFGVRAEGEGALVRVWRGSVAVREGRKRVQVSEGQRYLRGVVSALTDTDRLEPRVASLVGWSVGASVSNPRPSPVEVAAPLEVPESLVADAPPATAPSPALALRSTRAPAAPRPVATAPSAAEPAVDRQARLVELARGSTPEAATALFALAALRYDVAGDRPGAIRAWSEYVARFPGGPLVSAAREQLFEALLADGNVEGALVQGREAWAGAKGAERDRLALRLAEALHRHPSRPDDAVVLYEQVAEGGGALADRAAYQLIDALQRAGRTAEAHAALDRYLERFPGGAHVREVAAEKQRWSSPASTNP